MGLTCLTAKRKSALYKENLVISWRREELYWNQFKIKVKTKNMTLR